MPASEMNLDLGAIRRKSEYRAAVWLARLNMLLLLAWLYFTWTGQGGWPVVATWILVVVLILACLALFSKAGALVRRGSGVSSADQRKLTAQMYKDLFTLR